jgi:hypothetical protein
LKNDTISGLDRHAGKAHPTAGGSKHLLIFLGRTVDDLAIGQRQVQA